MFDDSEKPHRKHVREIPIAPILDMFVAVIFFLILSTTFIQVTKQGLPPSMVAETELDDLSTPPLSPKIVVRKLKGGLRLVMKWSGTHPGQLVRDLRTDVEGGHATRLKQEGEWLATYLNRQYPTQKSIQIGFMGDVVYQDVITVMDSVRKKVPDIVLMSYQDTASILGVQ